MRRYFLYVEPRGRNHFQRHNAERKFPNESVRRHSGGCGSKSDADESRFVEVEVFDWTENVPVALSVEGFNGPNGIPVGGGTVKIQPSTACAFFADVSEAFVYEVRVTFHGTSEDVVVNTFGLNSNDTTIEGTTVLYKDFKHVDLD